MKLITKFFGIGGVALATALFMGWWQVDGPGSTSTPRQRPLPLTEMNFELTNQNGEAVGPKTLIGQLSLLWLHPLSRRLPHYSLGHICVARRDRTRRE